MRSCVRRNRPWPIGLVVAGWVAFGSCGDVDEGARAYQIRSMAQAIGGPVSNGRVGDFVLENNEIRAVVEGGRRSRLFLDVGGTLIDADLVRHEQEFRSGRGLDELGQIAPVANLYQADARVPATVRVTGSDEGAEVTSSADAVPIQIIMSIFNVLLRREYVGSPSEYNYDKLQVYNEYEVRDGERLVRMVTTIGHDLEFCPVQSDAERQEHGCNAACDDFLYDDDCTCDSVPERCTAGDVVDANPLPEREGQGLLDILMGDLPRPVGSKRCLEDTQCDQEAGEACSIVTGSLAGISGVCRMPEDNTAGVGLGDMLLFGGNLDVFLPGPGHDTATDLQRLFERGVDTLSTPLLIDEVYAVGRHVSYGYSPPEGKVMIPIFGGSFSFGALASAGCKRDDAACLKGKLVRFERWVSLGEGDPASAREPIARARGEALGVVEGTLLEEGSGRPISRARIYAVADPRDTGHPELTDSDVAQLSVKELFDLNRQNTDTNVYLEGVAGVQTYALTDPGPQPRTRGKFRLALKPGRHVLVARDGNMLSRPVPIEVQANDAATTSLLMPKPARLEYAIFDETGEHAGGRLLIARPGGFPAGACRDDDDCSDGRLCLQGSCRQAPNPIIPLEVGGERFNDGVIAIDMSGSGRGGIDLPAGEYDLLFTRGARSDIDRQRVKLEQGVTALVEAKLVRAMDENGWIAADFHVHASPSLDSSLPLETRTETFLVDDMDFMSSSDHDILTDYVPVIERMGVADRLGTQIGAEVSSQELGHFIGWPLDYQLFQSKEAAKRAFDEDIEFRGLPEDTVNLDIEIDDAPALSVGERKVRIHGNGAFDWRGLTPKEIFAGLRKLAPEGGGPVVVEVPHPFSYFDFYNIDPFTLEPSETTLNQLNPLLAKSAFSWDFDAMEAINGKNMSRIRRASVAELKFFSEGVEVLIARRNAGEIDEEGFQRLRGQLATEVTRRILHRTPEEQLASLMGVGKDLPCTCGADSDCNPGSVCDPSTLSCVEEGMETGGDPADTKGICLRFRGVVDDWFMMLNRGLRRTVLGGSDTHGIYAGAAGSPRTMIMTHGTTPPHLKTDNIRDGILGAEAVVTNGPMIFFEVEGQPVGSMVKVGNGASVQLNLRVEAANWYDVDRIEIYRNGELLHWLRGCNSSFEEDDDPDAPDCLEPTSESTLVFDGAFADVPDGDAWYSVVALGLEGRNLSPVYSSATLSELGVFEVAQKVFSLIPALSAFRVPQKADLFPTFPVAVSNPVWVDVGSDGWEPPFAPPSGCRPNYDFGCQ